MRATPSLFERAMRNPVAVGARHARDPVAGNSPRFKPPSQPARPVPGNIPGPRVIGPHLWHSYTHERPPPAGLVRAAVCPSRDSSERSRGAPPEVQAAFYDEAVRDRVRNSAASDYRIVGIGRDGQRIVLGEHFAGVGEVSAAQRLLERELGLRERETDGPPRLDTAFFDRQRMPER